MVYNSYGQKKEGSELANDTTLTAEEKRSN